MRGFCLVLQFLAAVAAASSGAAAATARVYPGAPAARVQRCAAGTARNLGSSRLAFAAVVRRSAWAYARPGRRPFAHFGRLNVNGVPTVFGVRAEVVRADCRLFVGVVFVLAHVRVVGRLKCVIGQYLSDSLQQIVGSQFAQLLHNRL